MKHPFGNRRRVSDERRLGKPSTYSAQTHPLFSSALDDLPRARWAVACNAEFRAEGGDGLRGILHHDGAILRWTTWGGVERFAEAPMEFDWEQLQDATFRVWGPEVTALFSRLAPLSTFVQNPPPFAAAEDEDLAGSLASWMNTWAPAGVSPLTFPM